MKILFYQYGCTGNLKNKFPQEIWALCPWAVDGQGARKPNHRTISKYSGVSVLLTSAFESCILKV